MGTTGGFAAPQPAPSFAEREAASIAAGKAKGEEWNVVGKDGKSTGGSTSSSSRVRNRSSDSAGSTRFAKSDGVHGAAIDKRPLPVIFAEKTEKRRLLAEEKARKAADGSGPVKCT